MVTIQELEEKCLGEKIGPLGNTQNEKLCDEVFKKTDRGTTGMSNPICSLSTV
jgi:hypothetical protein